MVRIPKVVATLAVLAIAGRAAAQVPSSQPFSPGTVEWSSMLRSRVAVPLNAAGPMASDLSSRGAPPKWSDVPVPPPPSFAAAPAPAPAPVAAPVAAPAARQASAKALAKAPAKAPAAQDWAGPLAASSAAPAAAAPAAQDWAGPLGASSAAPAAQDAVAPLAATGPAATGMGAASLVAQDYSAPPPSQGAAGEPKVTTALDQTGAMVSVRQDLESDRIRQDWAARGGTIPGFEFNGGLTLLYKDLTKEAGEGAYMSGVGFNIGGRIVMLTLTPPKYETRDRDWTAWKIGGGIDLGSLTTQINIPQLSSPITSSMSTFTLVGLIGFMHAFGSFDSPTEWSGFAIGADWAPSYQSTSMKDSQSGQVTTNSSFNATGFAINFESGSMKSMAAKMGKKAHVKVSFFFLPPTGDIPFMMTASLGAVWY